MKKKELLLNVNIRPRQNRCSNSLTGGLPRNKFGKMCVRLSVRVEDAKN